MKILIVASVVFAVGCGSDGVSIKGNDPVADGQAVTDAVCEWQAECGDWDISCSGTPVDCTATRKNVSFQECQTEELQDITADFMCAGDLSASEKKLIEDCVNKIVDTACLTQAEVDAYLAAIEAGQDPMDLRESPPECEMLEPIFERCQ